MAHSSPGPVRTAYVPYSPPISTAPSQSTSSQSRLNIVSRLAIEGKVKQASDGASIKLHMKLTIPLESVTPGQIIPLFAEESVKIRDYGVHPIDSDSAPYNFSSTTNPLLHSTARALHLPSRTTKPYLSLFENVSHATPNRSANGSVIPPLEERYTGYFLISGYNVCFVLPKEFPPKYKPRSSEIDSDSEHASSRSHSHTPLRGRRSSIVEKSSLQFMAGLALSVPFSSKPPRAPYLLSIPIPRCLSNTIKVRLPPPAPVSTSFASLSSDEDSGGWDLATVPPVTRVAKPISRSTYSEFADDESSESSVGPEICMIQGTFTSSEHIMIRWANPLRMQEFPDHGDGRRRVVVTEVQGNMTCTVLSHLHDGGVKMRLDYQGTCTDIWFPGVAVLVGMDVGLDAYGCRVAWAPDSSGRWTVDGDAALTGFSVGLPHHPLAPESAFDLPQLNIQQASGSSGRLSREKGSPTGAVVPSDSLLRTPLPQHAMMEQSYEDSSTPTTSGLPSANTSLTRSSLAFGASESIPRPPSTPITLHLDLNNLIPTQRNKLVFNISGTVIVSRAHTINNVETSFDEETLPLPVFRVFSGESESISTTVRNLCDSANVEVLGPTDNLASSNREKKLVIPSGSQVKCSIERSGILVRPLAPPALASNELSQSSSTRDRKGYASVSRPTSPDLAGILSRERSLMFRDGPLIIPWVNADVVPICPAGEADPWSYAITLSLPTPVDGPSEWLEFGLALPPTSPDPHLATAILPSINVLCASVNGVPVRFEKFEQQRSLSAEPTGINLTGEQSPGVGSSKRRKWLCWMRVRVALAGALEVVYTITQNAEEAAVKPSRKRKGKDTENLNVLMPAFSLPVSRLEITLRKSSDVTVHDNSVDSTISRKVIRYNVEPFSYFNPTIPLPSSAAKQKYSWQYSNVLSVFMAVLPYILLAVMLNHTIGTRIELREMKAMVPAGNWSAPTALSLTTDLSYPSAVRTETPTLTQTVWSTSTVTVSMCQAQTQAQVASAAVASSSARAGRRYGHTYTVSYASPLSTVKTGQASASAPPQRTSRNAQAQSGKEAARRKGTDKDADAEDEDEDEDEDNDFLPTLDERALMPVLHVPFSWPIKLDYESAKSRVIRSWGRVWRVVEIILHWPLPVDAET